MAANWTIKVGDTQPAFVDVLKYSNGTIPPLIGATITLRLRSLANAGLQTLTGTTTVLDPNTGNVAFLPSAADTAVPGNYMAEWLVTFAASTNLGKQTFPTDGYNWIRIEPTSLSAASLLISPLDVREYLSVPANDRTRDSQLISWIQAVTPLIETEVGPIGLRTYEEWHDGGSNLIQLHRDPSAGFGSNPSLKLIAASEYRGPIEYPLALVASPAFGSIYSVMLIPDSAAITRRSAGGRTIAFMPGRDAIHVFYQVGQNPVPENVKRAALEAVRVLYRWPQQTGRGSLSPADGLDMGGAMHAELTRIVRMWTRPMRRFPAFG